MASDGARSNRSGSKGSGKTTSGRTANRVASSDRAVTGSGAKRGQQLRPGARDAEYGQTERSQGAGSTRLRHSGQWSGFRPRTRVRWNSRPQLAQTSVSISGWCSSETLGREGRGLGWSFAR
jgi:hypothetical protein